MCGILLSIAKHPGGSIARDVFERMLSALAKRGPDEGQIFERDGVQLGHRRLSIIDVAGGTQPIFNEDGTIACILNGEIYNYRELRVRLEKAGHRFSTHSDTEVLVHLYEELGENFLEPVVGMFAFVIADFPRRRVIVARDRLGEKPLYIHESSEHIVCASELKALLPYPHLNHSVNRQALAGYLRYGWVPGEQSIFAGIRRLAPATMLIIEGGRGREVRYWRPDLAQMPRTPRADIVQQLNHEMRAAMSNKLVADVPVGVLLSGGLDSSAVVAMCAEHADGPLRTFSVGFGETINELPYAREVAARYGTQHVELAIDANLPDAVNTVCDYFDEPFADSSSIPTYLICREARKHVKVILSGDGGDELLAGYGSYLPMRTYSDSRALRGGVRKLDALATRFLGAGVADALYPLAATGGARAYWESQRATFTPEDVLMLAGHGDPALTEDRIALPGSDALSRAFAFDLNWYLPDDLLKKVDMASMASSIECRAPLLDHKLVEFCMRIPPIEKLRGGDTKTLMREALQPMLPASVIWREKQGFGAPLVDWLTGPLAELANDSLRSSPMIADKLLDGAAVKSTVERSWSALRSDWRAPLKIWTLLMLELWLRRHPAVS